MARVGGVTIPQNKRVEIALTYIYGIGRKLSNDILIQAKIDPNKRTVQLGEAEVNELNRIINEKYRVEGFLHREVLSHIKRLKDINCYRGTRHMKHLPVRGQRTKTNSRTVRGNMRRTVGSGRKSANQKT
jgi:small subunit ribosomal protein S13